MRRLDLAGQRFGRLVAVSPHSKRGRDNLWSCACDCGSTSFVVVAKLRSGRTRSCGCLASDAVSARNMQAARHGMWKSPEFQAWLSMKKRCLSPSAPNYRDYGGRGITVFRDWIDSFEAFYAYVGPRPSSAHSLDRIRNHEGYAPGNVRWSTAQEQQNNRRCNVTALVGGRALTAAQIATEFGLPHSTVLKRIRSGADATGIVAPGRRRGAG
ncbi:MAG TPA: hypothetical protein P5305_01520 [Rubrivivax sp.]|nr:hypothetical protein [Rubrivivax sp.]HRY86532.1 hypothetical protein [Rubrivivax sp.]